jgi:hypothetical protein
MHTLINSVSDDDEMISCVGEHEWRDVNVRRRRGASSSSSWGSSAASSMHTRPAGCQAITIAGEEQEHEIKNRGGVWIW